MNNPMIEMRREMDNFVAVKACVYKRGNEYATVLCTVPSDSGSCDLMRMRDGSIRPVSCGTYIRAIGRMLISPLFLMTLTDYERYLEKEGWEFVFTVKEARGKHVKEAFEICRTTIKIAKRFLR